jgi:hypothetical protein
MAGGEGFEPSSQAPEACALSWLGYPPIRTVNKGLIKALGHKRLHPSRLNLTHRRRILLHIFQRMRNQSHAFHVFAAGRVNDASNPLIKGLNDEVELEAELYSSRNR